MQDLGRAGLAYYAIPAAGVMDRRAARIAQLLLDQEEDHPLLECTSLAPKIRFHATTRIALTGADFGWALNGVPLVLNTVIKVMDGDVLAGKTARDGLRGYLALNGRLDVAKTYGSYATYTNARMGGHQGRRLKKGDQLAWQPLDFDPFGTAGLPIHPGPEFDYLTPAARRRLAGVTFTVSPNSNRMGVRLQGTPLTATSYQLAHSLPVLPGFFQLPPSGLPIVILQDGQVSGGYPRIAYLERRYLSRLNQVNLGEAVRFQLVKNTGL